MYKIKTHIKLPVTTAQSMKAKSPARIDGTGVFASAHSRVPPVEVAGGAPDTQVAVGGLCVYGSLRGGLLLPVLQGIPVKAGYPS